MMPTHYIVDAEKDADMKSLSSEEAIAILNDMKIDIPVPKAAVTQRKRNVALDMAIEALSSSEIPNSSDTISRQQATDALDEQIEQCNKSLSSFDISMKDEYAVKVERASLVAFREILEYLPPAQLGTDLAEVGTDCISRQAAIDALDEIEAEVADGYGYQYAKWREYFVEMPPAQPEIVQCKDCKHFIREDIEEHTPYGFYNTYFHAFCDKHWDVEQGEYIDVKSDDFCSFAERREVTT